MPATPRRARNFGGDAAHQKLMMANLAASLVTKGTATILNDPKLPAVAGKTGTGEDPPRPDHAWFGGYAPAGKPTLVIVAFGENSGGYGGTVAAPMVRALMTTWFLGSQASNNAVAGG